MYLSEINIYPIKSLGGISLKESLIEERGLQYDRRWMLVDEKGDFLSQREYPGMAAFKMSLTGNGLGVTHGNDHLEIPFITQLESCGSVHLPEIYLYTCFLTVFLIDSEESLELSAAVR